MVSGRFNSPSLPRAEPGNVPLPGSRFPSDEAPLLVRLSSRSPSPSSKKRQASQKIQQQSLHRIVPWKTQKDFTNFLNTLNTDLEPETVFRQIFQGLVLGGAFYYAHGWAFGAFGRVAVTRIGQILFKLPDPFPVLEREVFNFVLSFFSARAAMRVINQLTLKKDLTEFWEVAKSFGVIDCLTLIIGVLSVLNTAAAQILDGAPDPELLAALIFGAMVNLPAVLQEATRNLIEKLLNNIFGFSLSLAAYSHAVFTSTTPLLLPDQTSASVEPLSEVSVAVDSIHQVLSPQEEESNPVLTVEDRHQHLTHFLQLSSPQLEKSDDGQCNAYLAAEEAIPLSLNCEPARAPVTLPPLPPHSPGPTSPRSGSGRMAYTMDLRSLGRRLAAGVPEEVVPKKVLPAENAKPYMPLDEWDKLQEKLREAYQLAVDQAQLAVIELLQEGKKHLQAQDADTIIEEASKRQAAEVALMESFCELKETPSLNRLLVLINQFKDLPAPRAQALWKYSVFWTLMGISLVGTAFRYGPPALESQLIYTHEMAVALTVMLGSVATNMAVLLTEAHDYTWDIKCTIGSIIDNLLILGVNGCLALGLYALTEVSSENLGLNGNKRVLAQIGSALAAASEVMTYTPALGGFVKSMKASTVKYVLAPVCFWKRPGTAKNPTTECLHSQYIQSSWGITKKLYAENLRIETAQQIDDAIKAIRRNGEALFTPHDPQDAMSCIFARILPPAIRAIDWSEKTLAAVRTQESERPPLQEIAGLVESSVACIPC